MSCECWNPGCLKTIVCVATVYTYVYIYSLIGPAFIGPSIENGTCNTTVSNCLATKVLVIGSTPFLSLNVCTYVYYTCVYNHMY